MPKRRRRRRRYHHKRQNVCNQFSVTKSEVDDKKNVQESAEEKVQLLDTTPVNKDKTMITRTERDYNGYICTNLNILFNESIPENALNNSPISDACKLNNKYNALALTNSFPFSSSPNEMSVYNLSKVNNNMESNKMLLNQGDCENHLLKPIYTSSPLYSATKLNNQEILKQINNKAYKDELNLKKLKSFNDVTIYASYNVQSLKSPSQINCDFNLKQNYINLSNFSEKSFDDCKYTCKKMSNISKRVSTRKFNKSKNCGRTHSISENFLHNIATNIISKIKRFHTRYVSKWLQNVVALCAWIGMVKAKKVFNCIYDIYLFFKLFDFY